MLPLSEVEIRSSFVNAPLHEVTRMVLPDLSAQPWEDLDFLGWIDRSGPHRGWIVCPYDDGPVGLLLRMPTDARAPRRTMCNICRSVHGRGGVRLASVPRIGAAGLRHNMVGTYICADLGCSLYARGLRPLQGFAQLPESLHVERRVAGVRSRLNALVARVLEPVPDLPGLDDEA